MSSACADCPKSATLPLNRQNLRAALIDQGIARPQDISGLSEEELCGLERRLGLMPRSYRDVLAVIGHRAGHLVDSQDVWIYVDQLEAVDRMARSLIFGRAEADPDPVPREALFIGAQYGEHPWFVLPGPCDDSPVFRCNTDTGRVTQIGSSVWTWVQHLLECAVRANGAGGPQQDARLGPESPQLCGGRPRA